jgi:predicted nucleic acid-binding protein
LIDDSDHHNQRVIESVRAITSWPLVTTEACLTEALYLLRRNAGTPGQEALWRFIDDGSLNILTPTPLAPQRAHAFMIEYADLPCDYADATLLVAAEDLGRRTLFSLDRHFYAYRLSNGDALELLR